MALFQKSVLKKYLKTLDDKKVKTAYDKYVAFFHNEEIIETIKEGKEEQFQHGFLVNLFVNTLGYTIRPNEGYNLTTELKNLKDSKKADGAIMKDGKAVGVIELKSTKTKELAKIEAQAFGYKNNHPTCVYIITSNFEKLRFYINDAVYHQDFDLFTLTEEQFKLLYLCLHKDHILADLPQKIKKDSTLKEEEVTKKLYKDYSGFKKVLFNDMVAKNPEMDKLLLFKKSQKLLDRFLFIFFAEDKGLLPPNSISKIVKRYERLKEEDFEKPLYDIFKQYFEYINSGRPAKGDRGEIFAFNGGLFAPDEILDNLKVTDNLLEVHTLLMSKYDFESEIDVNILGHIFEHSLNEIDEMTAQLEGQEIDKSKTKRKKDGVFYTPKYITKYIVDNTVGKLCEEKKIELKLNEDDFRPKRTKATKKNLLDVLESYRAYLLSLTICDPACGSGAFLNQALDFLIKEHHYIDELQTKLLGGSIVLSDITNDILERNIYGVDINEESVEIARLSLWLRTAQKGRALTTLSNNIKCGNSLIDDPTVAGDKAFNWEKEFPEVFKNGGFDVVIGNPPYVRQELLKPYKLFFEENFKSYQGGADLYTYFIEISLRKLLKLNGYYSIIVANKWIKAKYGKPLREWLKTKQIIEIIDFGDLPVFIDASAYPCILSIQNSKYKSEFSGIQVNNLSFGSLDEFVKNNSFIVPFKALNPDGWKIERLAKSNLNDKLLINSIKLDEYLNGNVFRGIASGCDDAFVINASIKEEICKTDPNSEEWIKPYLVGKDVKRYGYSDKKKFILFIPWDFEIEKYPAIKNHLLKFEERLSKRPEVKQGRYAWYAMSRYASKYYEKFDLPKLFYLKFQVKPAFAIEEKGYVLNSGIWFIPSKETFLLGLLNSKLGWFMISNYCTEIQNGYQLIYEYLKEIPIICETSKNKDQKDKIRTNAEIFIQKKSIIDKLINQLLRGLTRKFGIEKFSQKLQNWHKLTFTEFTKELKKKKVKLSLGEESEWEDYFETEKAKAQTLQSEIDKTDKEIDQMVYALYGLTEEEIGIVEGS